MSVAPTIPAGAPDVVREAARRRTFAIISHPDAGKTTLTEKLLLYGGAVTEAGSVKARSGGRAATSDWMELERRRGISVTSTALRFEHEGIVLNLLDTPGHRDFSEDTLRVLAAADAAVVLLDAARGVEEQTLKLFRVARARRIPLITFVNKYDRPGMEPLAMLDHIEEVLELAPSPLTWPVGLPGDFHGVVDRSTGRFHRYGRTAHGATAAAEEVLDAADAARVAGDAWETAAEELELVAGATAPYDHDAFLEGELTPVLFGSAISNFGVGLLLAALERHAPAPRPRPDSAGVPRPVDAPFSALVFKVQANMDPRHRDRLAFMRVCSGRFERGMRVTNARTGRPLALTYAHEVFAQDRAVLDEGYPGDVLGIVNAADVLVGDTLYAGGDEVRFGAIPTLAPEHFRVARNRDPGRRKQFVRGLEHLDQEGVVHVLERSGDPNPVLAAVGPLQFEVAVERLTGEFGAQVALDPLPWKVARRISPADADRVGGGRAHLLRRADGTHLVAFESDYWLSRFVADRPEIELEPLIA